eukprot:s481_g21.t1
MGRTFPLGEHGWCTPCKHGGCGVAAQVVFNQAPASAHQPKWKGELQTVGPVRRKADEQVPSQAIHATHGPKYKTKIAVGSPV